ncbi:SUZ domain-containing protein 1-like [Daphnia pulex]|uniref:SUZ RNA-binding domain-containing n=1 Tax=Daphnia pulex TaxID=6669 RepID=A0A4Y7MU39_DAPPU|nr:SUZ domain-containing protein 1-like [Daphnia pulex]XP_046464546.1 SUZ domain-containing protein 1-like [Daphnia pulex]XP_046652629.1 SUZ domain-containing protein 1-like [Daphnia pulicaria]XP_046652630.1 SUZ domain-containing protein 1-like [Daphnia pulicaria]XP_046652631.1 SUZ domain-containing protein 1-like [Daphnia pulicaria]SVE84076.1 EOG090X0RU6 [Daphnia pulex]SVE84688.1 EOG090X0RU6 [Daphnia pulex]
MAYMSSFQMKSPPSDGEILDDWEQMADSGLLDKKLQSLKTRIPEEVRNPDEIQQQTHFLFNGDGSVKPNVLGPPPQIKILKRPQHNGSAHAHQQGAFASSNGQAKPKPLVKTLQQKEAEYAEARLRILGEAAPANIPLPDLGISKLQNRMENLRTEESCLVRLPKGPDGTRGFNQQN